MANLHYLDVADVHEKSGMLSLNMSERRFNWDAVNQDERLGHGLCESP